MASRGTNTVGRVSNTGPVYLGVDIAGASNTWVSALARGDDGLAVVHGPSLASLEAIVGYCEANDVVAVTIDAQLTMALSDENGLRTSDRLLRRLLPPDCQDWVMSFNSLTAVPIRGRLLADHLSPIVGTMLETHPRASLCFGLGHVEDKISSAIREYKRKPNDTQRQTETRSRYTRELWRHWASRFNVARNSPVEHDGALDSLACATVAYQFHHAPETLRKLRHGTPEQTGRGPFYVLDPIFRAPVKQ